MPYANEADQKAWYKARWIKAKADPSLLEKHRAAARKSQRKRMQDPEIRATQYDRHRQWKDRNPDYKSAWRLKKFYGITLEDYQRMWDEQLGLCAICGQPEKAVAHQTKKPRRLAVDHCHKTNKVRGLLCYNCNHGMGEMGDDPDRLRAAAEYLERA